MWLFFGYVLLFYMVIEALFMLNRMSADSWEMAMRLEIFNFGAMAFLGLILFFIGKLFIEAKFIRFLHRLDAELEHEGFQLGHRFRFRESKYMPWKLEGLNAIIVSREDLLSQASELMKESLETIQEQLQSPQPNPQRIQKVIERIREFERGV